eukprot:TRINITY_DN14337_c0_g1_i1.p1 TRINITY_DN14337_c0_g1~~TRINITY_DN14337_c0_g1_i1.p1  ORF type:complete len:191 (-),score=51.82 TRINITY_DN14337_c0_g1_i1:49-621(-)
MTSPTRTVLVPIADGSEEIEAVSIIDTLRRGGANVTVASVSKGGELTVTCSRGVKIVADTSIDKAVEQEWDLIVLPGGMPGATHLSESEPLVKLLKKQKESGKLLGAICAAPVVVLQQHGLLDGVDATCHPSFEQKLNNASKANQRVVKHGNVLTSRGPGTAIEFALALVEELFGKTVADKTEAPMLVQR